MEDILRTERETRKFRLLAILLIAAGVYFAHDEVRFWPAIAAAFLYLVYISLLLFPFVQRLPARWAPYAMLAFDAAFVGFVMYAFGTNSPAFVLMPVLAVYYALYVGFAGSLVIASFLVFVYIGLTYLQGTDTALGRLLPIQIPLFYLLALFSAYSAQGRRRAQREREDLSVALQAERGARAVLEMTSELATVLDLDVLVPQALGLAATAAECKYGTIRLVEGPGNRLGAVAAIVPESPGSGEPTAAMLREASPLERESLSDRSAFELVDPDPERTGAWSTVKPAYILVVPLLSEGSAVGVLTLANSEPLVSMGTAQQDLMRQLAQFFAHFIAKSRAYAAARSQSERASGELRGAVQQIERKQRLRQKSEVRVGQLLLEPSLQRASLGAKRLELSAKEFDVLYLLAKHVGQPVHHELMLRELWGEQELTRSNLVDVTINRLRRKLTEQAEAGSAVQTLRGAGYVLDGRNPALTGGNGKDGGDLPARRSPRAPTGGAAP